MTPRIGTLNPARRFAVRLGLAGGATVTALIGAQSLALLDRPSNRALDTAASSAIQADVAANTVSQDTSSNLVSNTQVLPAAAPKLVIIRNPGMAPTILGAVPTGANSQSAQIAPPAARLLPPPAPVVVYAAAPAPIIVNSGGGGGSGSHSQPAPASHSSH